MKKTAEQMVYNAKNWQWQRTCKEFRTWQKNIAAFARTASRDYFKEILYQEVFMYLNIFLILSRAVDLQKWVDKTDSVMYYGI